LLKVLRNLMVAKVKRSALRNLMAAHGSYRSNTSTPITPRVHASGRSLADPVLRRDSRSARRGVGDFEETITFRQSRASASHPVFGSQVTESLPLSRLLSPRGSSGRFDDATATGSSADSRSARAGMASPAAASVAASGSSHSSPRSSSSHNSVIGALQSQLALLTQMVGDQQKMIMEQQIAITTAMQGMANQQATLPAVLATALATTRPPAIRKPYDAFPTLAPYSGDGPPNRFLREFRTWNRIREDGPLEPAALVSQLLGKLTGKAAQWASRRFADGTPPTVATVYLGRSPRGFWTRVPRGPCLTRHLPSPHELSVEWTTTPSCPGRITRTSA